MVDRRQWQNGWGPGQKLPGWEELADALLTLNGKKETLIF